VFGEKKFIYKCPSPLYAFAVSNVRPPPSKIPDYA